MAKIEEKKDGGGAGDWHTPKIAMDRFTWGGLSRVLLMSLLLVDRDLLFACPERALAGATRTSRAARRTCAAMRPSDVVRMRREGDEGRDT
jgi:hypothetical protein